MKAGTGSVSRKQTLNWDFEACLPTIQESTSTASLMLSGELLAPG